MAYFTEVVMIRQSQRTWDGNRYPTVYISQSNHDAGGIKPLLS